MTGARRARTGTGGGDAGRPRIGVVLAAGKGTRMRSALPKVLHPVAGRPMLAWVLDAVRAAGCDRILVIVGHGSEEVQGALGGDDVSFVLQAEQRGTGHALAQVAAAVRAPATLLVVSGDVPLVTPPTLAALAAAAGGCWGAMAVAELTDPGSLGRVVTGAAGTLERIVEAADASPGELALGLVNSGLYALPAPEIFAYLDRLEPRNAQGELYLTDALGAAVAGGEQVALVRLDDPAEALGVNDRRELVRVHRRLLRRRAEELMIAGVTVLDPDGVSLEPAVEVGSDTVIHPGVSLLGTSRVGSGCVLHQGAWLRDTTLADGVEVLPYSVLDGAVVGAGSRVGPFARLRPGADLADGCRVGNFVEVKAARLERGVKVNHLAYVGDASVGEGSNLGAGVVTCNYDGEQKHRTEIGRQVFVGSDTMLVAPVRVGDGATIAAGSVITKEVPAEALAVARPPQRHLPGWSRRRRRKPEES